MEFEKIDPAVNLYGSPNAPLVLAALKRFGFYQLCGGFFHCACGGFELAGINVEVSCHGDSVVFEGGCRLVSVYSHHMDWEPADGKEIAAEVVRQQFSDGEHVEVVCVRYGPWSAEPVPPDEVHRQPQFAGVDFAPAQ